MLMLTPQQQKVLITVLFLLLFGWTVKLVRLAHPPARVQAGAVAK